MPRTDWLQHIGFDPRHPLDAEGRAYLQRRLRRYVNLRLSALGCPAVDAPADAEFATIARGLLESYRVKTELLSEHRCPVDQRLETFLQDYFASIDGIDATSLRLPTTTFTLDRHGLAREISLPANGDRFHSEYVESYRVLNGVLHNPRHDRRTTKGTFHVAEGGLPVPFGKKAVPRDVAARLFAAAMRPPDDLLTLPFTSELDEPARLFVSLYLKPLVSPEVAGVSPEQRMEVRFFAPGGLVSNLDFVESIFGNAGDPLLPENDIACDVQRWGGCTGGVILAPHLSHLTKKQLGLPHVDDATERQKLDGMCWSDPAECYNDGTPFKLTCRDRRGVIVTLIADNYFGYCKKEVKTQISYAANLAGNAEEEHSGGAWVYPAYNLGEEFHAESRKYNGRTWADLRRDYHGMIDFKPQGYGVDRRFDRLIYVKEDAHFSVTTQRVTWNHEGREHSLPLHPDNVYMTTSGYKVRLDKHPAAPSWRLVGTVGEGAFCHKPCTVSGGGKSEISKSLNDYMLYGPIFTADLESDLDQVQAIFNRDYSDRWGPDSTIRPDYATRPSRSPLATERSLGSVIKLLTPSPDYTDAYNAWLESIPSHIYALVFIIKRFYKPEWGGDWRKHFSVDIVNGMPGNEIKYDGRQLVGSYLRVGFDKGGAWRTFKLRQDFMPADKVQAEDDITASVVLPTEPLTDLPRSTRERHASIKFSENCEFRLFQRPDEAIHRGFDKQAEADIARRDNFIVNYEPLDRDTVGGMVAAIVEFDLYTDPMRELLYDAIAPDDEADAGERAKPEYVVSSSMPVVIDGKASKNPRYLQTRPDLVDPFPRHVAEMGVRLMRGVGGDQPARQPVTAVLVGRRNNPPDPDAGIRSLAVFNPIHYQPLPEFFMDAVASLTGKSPSTTGAGSEGALTKGPFNALRPTADLNAALVSAILTGYPCFISAAGYVGPHSRVDHDVSLLIPEVWSRMTPEERSAEYLIDQGMLEPLEDFEHQGETILASRLGYRITRRFIRGIFGRIFDNPARVFDESILKPETQDMAAYIDGIKNICEAQQRVAQAYLDDGSVEEACPPLKALLHIMATGDYQGRDAHDPDVRALFTRESLLASDWYRARLDARQQRDIALWQRHVAYLDKGVDPRLLAEPRFAQELADRRVIAQRRLEEVQTDAYRATLVGTIGTEPDLVAG